MQALRHPRRLALELLLMAVTCAWPTPASAQPPARPGSEVINPWAPASVRAHAGWRGPDGSEIIDPWRSMQRHAPRREEAFIVDPWNGQHSAVPTAAFPAPEVVDPWAR